MTQTTLEGLDTPDELREFPHGRFEIIHLVGVNLGGARERPIEVSGGLIRCAWC